MLFGVMDSLENPIKSLIKTRKTHVHLKHGVQFQERFTHSLSQVTNPLIITKGKTHLARCQTEYDSGTRI